MKKQLLVLPVLLALSLNSFAEAPPVGGDVTITPSAKKGKVEQTIIEEFKNRGIRYIKVTPKKGPSYYLIDSDGDADMDTRRNELDPNLMIPSWTIFTW